MELLVERINSNGGIQSCPAMEAGSEEAVRPKGMGAHSERMAEGRATAACSGDVGGGHSSPLPPLSDEEMCLLEVYMGVGCPC
ncbi:hypothetical protein OsI_12042 [Oryza sativa Indica Group]|uniref:Uncharacterized protein n=1 Tax=Oryza sativa subsp. indica TaxID=39946 RepID=B8AJS0_ORYSI|nr:hypothetical protein OsI_12042 [Oryza sativa Indica Group]